MKYTKLLSDTNIELTRIKRDPYDFLQCMSHPSYFSHHILGITPYKYQHLILRKFADDYIRSNSRIMICKSRQIGISICLAILAIWYAAYNKSGAGQGTSIYKNTKVGIISKSDKQAVKLMKEIQNIIWHSKMGFSDLIKNKRGNPLSKTEIHFENGWIKAYPPTSASRGETFDLLIVDEAAFVDGDEFRDSMEPTVSAVEGKIILSSTPKGQCYSEDTYVMTREGWKLFSNLKTEDELLCKTDNGVTFYNKPFRLIRKKYKGDMVHIKSRQLNSLVTPDHSMWGKFQKGKFKFFKANQMFSSKTDIWFDRTIRDYERLIKPDNIIIPSITYPIGKGGHTTEQIILPLIPFMKWLGFWYAEGHITNIKGNRSISITQNKGKIFEDILLLTNQLFSKYFKIRSFKHNKKKGMRITISSKQLVEFLKDFKQKGLPSFIKNLHKKALKSFIEGYQLGDGDERGRLAVDAKYPQMVLDIHELCCKLGYKSNILYAGNNCYRITRNKGDFSKIKTYDDFSKPELIKYEGYVYCATVPFHKLYVMRNGRPMWSGNSGFFFELFDPYDVHKEHEYQRYWFHWEMCENPIQTKMIKEKEVHARRTGDYKSFEQEYKAMFTADEEAFFEDQDVENGVDRSLSEEYEYTQTPCSIGVDYGGSKAQTAITVVTKIKNKIVLLFQFGQPNFDENLLMSPEWEHSIPNLFKRYYVHHLVVDNCPQGTRTNQQLENEGYPVLRYNFRTDAQKGERNRGYYLLRSHLKEGRIKYPDIRPLLREMKTIQEIRVTSGVFMRIKAPPTYFDDRVDSLMMACYPFLMNDGTFSSEVIDYASVREEKDKKERNLFDGRYDTEWERIKLKTDPYSFFFGKNKGGIKE